MPAKGEIYATLNIDLARWLRDYTARYGLSPADVAHRTGLNRGRVTELADGKCATLKYIHIVVEKLLSGDYLALLPYCGDDEARLALWGELVYRRYRLNPKAQEALSRCLTSVYQFVLATSIDEAERELKRLMKKSKGRAEREPNPLTS